MIPLKQGSTRPIDATLERNGQPLDVAGHSITFRMRQILGAKFVTGAATFLTDGTDGKVRFTPSAANTDTPGIYRYEWWDSTLEGIPDAGYGYLRIQPAVA